MDLGLSSTFNSIYIGHKKEGIWVSCSELDEPGASYTEWSMSEREKRVSYIKAYTYGIQKNGTDEPGREQTCGHSKWRRGWDELRK